MPNRRRGLIFALRAIGLLDLIAWIAVFASRTWIAQVHEWVGLGTFPTEPIVGYLARLTSLWYGTYGLLLWFVSFDVERYERLITCLAATMFLQGFIVIGIDFAEGLPPWWIAMEGPGCSTLGALLLAAQHWPGGEPPSTGLNS